MEQWLASDPRKMTVYSQGIIRKVRSKKSKRHTTTKSHTSVVEEEGWTGNGVAPGDISSVLSFNAVERSMEGRRVRRTPYSKSNALVLLYAYWELGDEVKSLTVRVPVPGTSPFGNSACTRPDNGEWVSPKEDSSLGSTTAPAITISGRVDKARDVVFGAALGFGTGHKLEASEAHASESHRYPWVWAWV
ncbi:hypothetical protein AXG93_2145s1700 [Marchantia polymorpha subsp. ruderalis]|uniref:Uncharacterized protein n=1 Tax=Marchantia polymorpha subsp. ruderalis TaxID=1480154 RepID=A0A176W019_MARPO|nr:hypothetical protein AXG93_2145s1700 [Marchantia polymorpha subsp. ruderalis]